MRKAALFSLILCALPLTATAKSPVLVELFTAQGCASCGEANAYLGKLAERQGVLALTFPVDYWDYLGWSDTFAKPEFTDRQEAYVERLDLRGPYTPQMVIDGNAQAGGLQADKVDRLIVQAATSDYPTPDTAFIGSRRVDVGSGLVPRGGAEVWLVRYDPRKQEVVVKTGDNRGQTVVHHNVVRQIERLGAWRGRPTAYRLPKAGEAGLSTVVLVQAKSGGRIIAVARKN